MLIAVKKIINLVATLDADKNFFCKAHRIGTEWNSQDDF